MDYGLGINRKDLNGSHQFGFRATCTQTPDCPPPTNQLLDVRGIQLTAQDNTAPLVLPTGTNNIWFESSGWIRGSWPAGFLAGDDSGICGMSEVVDGQYFSGPSSARYQSSWTQCPDPQTMNATIDTSRYPDGQMTLVMSAADAASPPNISSPSGTLRVDNSPVGLSLTGPTDALSTSGTQYVDAAATAGPSGVADIRCSVDGSPPASYPGASAQVPVNGIGSHVVSCNARNEAIDQNGNQAQSATQTWSLTIRQPTISGITFGTRLLDALRCHTNYVLVRGRSRWVTIHRHGRPVWVLRRGRSHLRREVRCHPRIVIRRVRINGRTTTRRIVLLPHRVDITVKRVRFRRAATVSGWLGHPDGSAVANATVTVMTATDDGRGQWLPAAQVTTSRAGVWQATLRPGPSRLVAAAYPGSTIEEPASSADVTLVSRTVVRLRIRPRSTHWGATIQISGRVLGGHVPAGKLLRLRIGTAGIFSTVGIPNIDGRGRFHTTWTFAPGHGIVRYWFSVSTLGEADYPYAQTSSRRVYVTVRG